MSEAGIPNLDGMDISELLVIADTPIEKLAEAWGVADLWAVETAKRYASLKASAIEHRLAGRIEQAIRMERACDRIYGELPQSAVW